MPPKTPKQLRDEVQKQNQDNPPAEGQSRTAEGLETPDPSRDEFFGNLKKASKPERS